MTLYVVQVPNPPAGQDWSAKVPGQYLYDITTITATLAPAAATAALADASGNGNNGTYGTDGPFGAFVPGILAGRNAWHPAAAPVAPSFDNATIPHGLVDWLSPFTIAWWQEWLVSEAGGGISWFESADAMSSPLLRVVGNVQNGTPGAQPLSVFAGTQTWLAPHDALVIDGLPHHIALVWDMATLALYIDGAFVPWVTFVPGILSTEAAASAVLGDPDVGAGIFQAVGTFPVDLTAGQVAALHLAGTVDAATYGAAAFALSPNAFYWLDGVGGAIGRTPALDVTDGTSTVVRIGDGFPAGAVPGPYKYTWQLNLPADSRSADGTITTVGTPRLIIPAGYTVGSRTPDLGPGDQWSDVVIWWDDTVQRLTVDLPEYGYPPGAFYTYRQIGS